MARPDPSNDDVILSRGNVLLRFVHMQDEVALHAIAAREEVARPTSIPHPLDPSFTHEWLEKQAELRRQGLGFAFAIIQQASGKLIGDATLYVDPDNRRAELGYILDPVAWGRGYATETARLVLEFGFERLHLRRIEAECFAWHVPSARVLEKIGMRREGLMRDRTFKNNQWHDDCLYAITEPMFRALQRRGMSRGEIRIGDALPRPMSPERIETDRLILRGLTEADLEEHAQLLNEPGISEYTRSLPYPYTLEEARITLRKHRERHQAGEGMVWTLCEKQGGGQVGSVGLYVDRQDSNAELGYWINSAFRGRGYATEAARAAMRYGFETLGLARVYGTYFADNPASGHILRKIGMIDEGVARGHSFRGGWQRDIVNLGLLRAEYFAREESKR